MKPYVKPQLFFESYELSQHVAACRWDINTNDGDVCEATYDDDLDNKTPSAFPEMILFTNNNKDCNIKDHGEYCYTNGSETAKVFMS